MRPLWLLCLSSVLAYTPLSDLKAVDALQDASHNLDFRDPASFLAQILVPRAAGSQNLSRVQDLIVSRFQALHQKSSRGSWAWVEDGFTDSTPIGPVNFRNLIFTHNPQAETKLVLAAHTDSKWFDSAPMNQFVGATDSAVPCAMMLDVAEALSNWLDAREDALDALDAQLLQQGKEKKPRTSLTFLFLDGEEAFENWSLTDSIYGARHLAKVWSETPTTPSAKTPRPSSAISQISTFILLDLLGTPNPYIRNYYANTGWLYDRMIDVEDRLGEEGILWPGLDGEDWATDDFVQPAGAHLPSRSFFEKRLTASIFGGHIEDDHLPFLHAGVPVVHVIPIPFPDVWHKIEVRSLLVVQTGRGLMVGKDDASALDYPTIRAWSKILQVVTAEFLDLSPSHLKRQRDELVRGLVTPAKTL